MKFGRAQYVAVLLPLLLASALPTASAAERYGFKDDTLGESVQDFKAKHPAETWGQLEGAADDHDCFREGDGKLSCPAKTTILGTETIAFYQFLNERLYQIQVPFSPNDFSALLQGLKEKYGAPTESTQAYQNRFGAHFDGRIATWTNNEDAIILTERATVSAPMSGKIAYQYALRFPNDPLKESLLRIVDSATLQDLSKPKNPRDF
jgi:hypothetical protein